MTTETSINGVIEEIANSIIAITPNRQPREGSDYFSLHKSNKVGGEGLREHPKTRRFEIEDLKPVGNPHLGHAYEGRLWNVNVTFCYPRGGMGLEKQQWRGIAADDVEEIRYWFRINQGGSGVSGIASRYFEPTIEPSWEEHPTDPWDFVTMVMRIETSIDMTA